LPRPSRSKG